MFVVKLLTQDSLVERKIAITNPWRVHKLTHAPLFKWRHW